MARDDLELWLLRALWLILPFTVGSALGEALSDSPRAAQIVLTIGAWAIWAATMIALMVPRTQTLTLIRIVGPAVVALTIWAAIDIADASLMLLLAAMTAAITMVLALRSTVGDLLVDGSSYGDENRFLLSTPGPLLLGPLLAIWAAMVGGIGIGAVALLHERFVVGIIAAIIGVAATVVGVPIFDRLSNRWIVFVPAGVVLHDKTALREPQLFDHLSVSEFGPAPAAGPDHDLTLGALGLALRVHLTEPSNVVKNSRSESVELTEIEGFVFSPNRPGAVVAEAKRRGLRLG